MAKNSRWAVEYYWVPETRVVEVPHRPLSVQTVLGAAGGRNQDEKPQVENPVHAKNVWFESLADGDWCWARGKLRYASQQVGHGVWIRVELPSRAASIDALK